MWIYRAHILSRSGERYTAYEKAIVDEEYADPEIRKWIEDEAKYQLRHMEGVTPETPIYEDGWRHVDHAQFGGKGDGERQL